MPCTRWCLGSGVEVASAPSAAFPHSVSHPWGQGVCLGAVSALCSHSSVHTGHSLHSLHSCF